MGAGVVILSVITYTWPPKEGSVAVARGGHRTASVAG